jgi:peptidyl-prolyl cis-trans isomerase D
MAVIGRIRKHSTILLVVVAVALLSFLVGDFTRKNRSNKIYDRFITIGKDNISLPMFQSKHEQNKELYRKNYNRNLEPGEDFQAGMQAYEELVDSVVFARQAGYLGISITADELWNLVAGPNPHPIAAQFFPTPEGGYNMQLAQYFVENLAHIAQTQDSIFVQRYLEYVEPTIEKEAFKSKYLNLLSGAYYMPKVFAQKISNESSMKADLEVIQIPYSSEMVSDDKISFTEEDLKKCYEENKYRFQQDEELRHVDYVTFNIEPTEEDLRKIEEEVQKMFEEFKETDRPDYFVNRLMDSRYDSTYFKKGVLEPGVDTLLFNAPVGTFVAPFIDGDYWKFAKLLSAQTRPDSINVSYLFVGWNGTEQKKKKKEESQLIADSAYRAVMAGANFIEMSEKYSDIPPSQMPDSCKVWLVDGAGTTQLGDDQHAFDTLYGFNTGTIIKRELPGGILIYRLNEKTAAERKIQVAIGRKQIMASSETVNNLESAAHNFVNGTDTYQKFVDAATAKNLDKRTSDRVTKMTYTLPGIRDGGREIIRWIFGDDTKKGNVSGVFNLENMFVVVVLKDIYPEGYMSLDNEIVKNQIESMVKRDKKAEKLEVIFKEQISKYKTLNAISENNDIELNTLTITFTSRNFGNYGTEVKMIGKIFGEATTGKIEILKGDMGVYAIKVNKFDILTIESAPADESISMMQMQSKMMYQRRTANDGSKILRKMYKITDNRYKTM